MAKMRTGVAGTEQTEQVLPRTSESHFPNSTSTVRIFRSGTDPISDIHIPYHLVVVVLDVGTLGTTLIKKPKSPSFQNGS